MFNCSVTATGFSQPYGLKGQNGYVYVAEYANSAQVRKCTISTAGALTNCIGTGSDFNGPLDFAFYGSWAYVANGAGSYVSKCNVTAEGDFIGCVNGASVSGSAYGTFRYRYHRVRELEYRTTNRTYGALIWYALGAGVLGTTLYITNANGNTVTKCDIDPSSGSLSNCGFTGTVEQRPYSISFYAGVYAYITNESSRTVTKCEIAAIDGALINCGDSGYNLGQQVNYSVVTASYLLLTAFNAGVVYRCDITPGTGALTNCISVGSGFDGPMGMTVG